MVDDAARFAEEDSSLKQRIESRNAYENCASLPLAHVFRHALTVTPHRTPALYAVKSLVGDEAGLGGKLDSTGKK